MKLQIISDLHLEFGPLELPLKGADVLIAAGDIAPGYDGLKWLECFSCPVLYVAGNHEYWGQDIDVLVSDLTQSTQQGSIFFLERRKVILENVRFLGCTLWTDFNASDPQVMQELNFMMNDFRYISHKGRPLAPLDLVDIHAISLKWLKTQLNEPYPGKTVIITHHAPLHKSWFAGRKDNSKFAYCNELADIIKAYDIDLWVHGHVHEVCDYNSHGVRVVCNPRGYAGYQEVAGFMRNKIIEV